MPRMRYLRSPCSLLCSELLFSTMTIVMVIRIIYALFEIVRYERIATLFGSINILIIEIKVRLDSIEKWNNLEAYLFEFSIFCSNSADVDEQGRRGSILRTKMASASDLDNQNILIYPTMFLSSADIEYARIWFYSISYANCPPGVHSVHWKWCLRRGWEKVGRFKMI
jgi:hypothetical protein